MNRKQRSKLFVYYSVAIFSVFGIALSSLGMFMTAQTALKQHSDSKTTDPSVLGAITGKEGYVLRYNSTENGGITFTGNTLCLSESSAAHGSCGTFISTNTALTDNDFVPKTAGTTANWKQNSSSSKLNLPENSEILHAELIWGGNYSYLNESVASELDKAITLETPKGSFQVTPASNIGGEITASASYVRTQDITNIVKQAGGGTYTAKGIPSVLVKNNPYNNYVGYTIAVAYKDSAQPARNLSIFVGAEQVGADQFTNIAEVKGFATPTNGNVNGKLFVSSQEGDNMYKGDRMRFGSDRNNLKDLQGPNNSVDNFFASQINGDDGKINTSGTFGNLNQPNNGTNKEATRQGWDITAVDISNQLQNNQTAAYAQGVSTGDSYVINALGMQIDVNAAKPEITLNLPNQNLVCPGKTAPVELIVKNNGSTVSDKTIVSKLTPANATLVNDSVKVNGQKINYNQGIDLGKLNPGESKTITYEISFSSQNVSEYVFDVQVDYEYQMIAGGSVTKATNNKKSTIKVTQDCGNPKPPTAVDDSKQTSKNTSVEVDVLKNDTDSDGELVVNTLEITKQPTNGTVKIENGKTTYTPNTDYTGGDTYEYKICDNDGLCDEAKVTITIGEVLGDDQLPPIANDDKKSTKKNTPVEISILDNDSNPDGSIDEVETSLVTEAKNGTVKIENRKAIYTPKPDFVGEDTFNYKICNEIDLCDDAIVTITINDSQAQPLPPVATDDVKSTKKNSRVNIIINNNDSDPDGDLSKADFSIVKDPKNGSVVINEDQSATYTPNTDFVGEDTFDYKLCDTDKLCDNATVTVTVIDEEKEPPAPIVNGDSNQVEAVDDKSEGQINQPQTIDILINDKIDSVKSITIISNPQNGSLYTTPDNKIVYQPKPDYAGSDQFVYRVCNNDNLCDNATVDIQVKPAGLVLGDSSLVRSGGLSIGGFVVFLASAILSTRMATKKKRQKLQVN